MNRTLIAFVVLALLVAACGGAADDSPSADSVAAPGETTQPTETSAPDVTAQPPETSAPTTQPVEESTPTTRPAEEGSSTTQPGGESVPGAYPQDKVDIAINDLAARIGVDPGSITVQSVEEVTWRDGSLGCPLPGMSYTQALVDGMRIILEADGTQYHYHSGKARDPFYCANPSEPLNGAAGGM